mgnify:CR=1 FL=1
MFAAQPYRFGDLDKSRLELQALIASVTRLPVNSLCVIIVAYLSSYTNANLPARTGQLDASSKRDPLLTFPIYFARGTHVESLLPYTKWDRPRSVLQLCSFSVHCWQVQRARPGPISLLQTATVSNSDWRRGKRTKPGFFDFANVAQSRMAQYVRIEWVEDLAPLRVLLQPDSNSDNGADRKQNLLAADQIFAGTQRCTCTALNSVPGRRDTCTAFCALRWILSH